MQKIACIEKGKTGEAENGYFDFQKGDGNKEHAEKRKISAELVGENTPDGRFCSNRS